MTDQWDEKARELCGHADDRCEAFIATALRAAVEAERASCEAIARKRAIWLTFGHDAVIQVADAIRARSTPPREAKP